MRSADFGARPRPNPWVTVVLAVVLTLLDGCIGGDDSTGARGDLADASRQTSIGLPVAEMEAVLSYDA